VTKADTTIIIGADEAVFWMDRQGRWCNAHGRIHHKRTVDYLNRCIGHDAGGWYVGQRRENFREKVYFNCPDTALLAIDLEIGEKNVLVLNTGRRVPLKPRRLIIADDILYQIAGPVRIRFTERAAAKLMPLIEEGQNAWSIRVGTRRYRIQDAATQNQKPFGYESEGSDFNSDSRNLTRSADR